MTQENTAVGSFAKRSGLAALNLLAVLQIGLLLFYFILGGLLESDWWLVDILGFLLPWLFLPLLLLLPLTLWIRRPIPLALTGLSGLLFLLTYGAYFLPALPPKASGESFTVMSYNVLFANDQAGPILAEIARHDADVLGLQEFYPPKAEILQAHLVEIYPYYIIEASFALFSRFPLEDCQILHRAGQISGWIQRCALKVDGRRLALYHLHARPPHTIAGLRFGFSMPVLVDLEREQNRSDLQALFPYLQAEEDPLLIFGDFNQTDTGTQVQALRQTLEDAFLERGWGLGFTFSRLGLPVWRIDYIFHSPELVARQARIGAFSGSDHRPVIVEFGFADP